MTKKYDGLIIDTHTVKDAPSKAYASKNLFGWKYVSLTAHEWIQHLEKGHTIQPSTFTPKTEGTWTHRKENWHATHFICCDADNIKGVEFHDNGTDKNPDGVDAFTSETSLSRLYPTLADTVYAVCQSVSSMSDAKPPPHRRYRLIFLFDDPITDEKHYHHVLLALSREYPIIPPIERSPAQPVFGNARAGYYTAAIPGNILALSDYPYIPPPPTENTADRQQTQHNTQNTSATDTELHQLLSENNIPHETRERGGFFVTCPYREGHTRSINNPTDAYVFSGNQGFAFYCSHTSCEVNGNRTWQRFKEGYDIKGHTRHKKIKLHKTDSQLILETLDTSRAFLAEVFESNAKVFGLRADTGVGKNEAAIQHVYKGIKLLLNMPHQDLMNELAARFDKAEIPPFAYRGITSNTDGAFPLESPCIQPFNYDGYAQKGGNPRDVICSRCPVIGTCEEAGHWHDLRQLKKYQVNLFTFPQLFTNPIFQGWIQTNIGTLEKDDLILHDDTEITSLFNIIKVRREYLENVSRQHHGTNTGSFADILLSLLHTDALYEKLRTFIFDEITEEEREPIIEGLSHVRIDGQLLTLDEAVERRHFQIDRHADIVALPAVADPEWTLLHQLELFFDMYPYADNAPIRYSEGVLSFAIAPILPKTPARIGFMGATLQEEHLKRAFPAEYYPNVQFFDATSTEWHPDARVYQLATNRNPRRTVLTDGKLNATGQDYWNSVMKIVNRLEGKHAIITYKAVIDEKQAEIETHDIIEAHFGALTGLDERFKKIDYLHILFSPERPPLALEWDAKMIYGADAEILSFDRDEAGEFTDKRVQSVYDAGAIAELIQAIGRARLVNEKIEIGRKVFVWCSHHLPTITEREQTHLFTEQDIEMWTDADTETLQNIIANRQNATPKETAEQDNVSQSTAYRRTEQARKKDKTARDAEIMRLHHDGHKQSDIVMHLTKHFGKINQGTVSRVIQKNMQNSH